MSKPDPGPSTATRRLGAVVLVGGRSSRLGTDKALMEVEGSPSARRVMEAVRPLVDSMCLVGGEAERFASWGVSWCPDAASGGGPLAGIVTGLRALDADACFALACDTPLLRTVVLVCLLDALDESPDVDAVVPRLALGLEPLVAVYTRTALPVLEEALARGERALHRVLGRLRVREVDESTLRRLDWGLASFVNVNTPSDLEAVRARLAGPHRGDEVDAFPGQ